MTRISSQKPKIKQKQQKLLKPNQQQQQQTPNTSGRDSTDQWIYGIKTVYCFIVSHEPWH